MATDAPAHARRPPRAHLAGRGPGRRSGPFRCAKPAWLALLVAVLPALLMAGGSGAADPAGPVADAWLLIKAVREPRSTRQPTWIAMRRLGAPGRPAVVHVPADAAIVAVEPGRYRISHVDFDPNPDLRAAMLPVEPFVPIRGSRELNRAIRFDAVAGAISHFGELRLTRVGADPLHRDIAVSVVVSEHGLGEQLRRACAARPDLLAGRPVRLLGAPDVRPVRIDCGSG